MLFGVLEVIIWLLLVRIMYHDIHPAITGYLLRFWGMELAKGDQFWLPKSVLVWLDYLRDSILATPPTVLANQIIQWIIIQFYHQPHLLQYCRGISDCK